MNKIEFINTLKEKTNLSENDCIIINNILENNFLIGKSNQEKIINDFKKELIIDDIWATKIYNVTISIIKDELKYKMRHPFKSKK